MEVGRPSVTQTLTSHLRSSTPRNLERGGVDSNDRPTDDEQVGTPVRYAGVGSGRGS
jgi:hypothetical protein